MTDLSLAQNGMEKLLHKVTYVRKDPLELMLLDIPAAYKHGGERFISFLKQMGYGLSYEGLLEYRNYLEEKRDGKRYAARSLNYYLAAAKNRIKAVLQSAEADLTAAEKYRIEQALEKIKGEKVASTKVDKEKVLTIDQVKELIRCPKPKVSLWVEFLFLTATRVSEMLNILLSDLKEVGDFYEARIHGKGHKERTVRVSYDLITRIRKEFDGTVYLFESSHRKPTPYRREYVSMDIKRQARKILGIDASAHTLRHSAATHALAKSGEGRIRAVQNLLGHSSASTTVNLYVHDDFSWEEQSKIFNLNGST